MFWEAATAVVLSCSGGDAKPQTVVVNQPDQRPAYVVTIRSNTLSLSTEGGPALVGWTDQDAFGVIPTWYVMPIR